MGVLASDSLNHLRARMDGAVVAPAEPGWAAVTRAFNLAVAQEPALVALPQDARDVALVVHYAAAHGMQIAPQRSGHGAEPLGALDDVVLLRTDRLQGVRIDVERRAARVRAGVTWASLLPAASRLGLAAPHGSTPDVGIAGYALGGGVGWYGRKLGLAANSVIEVELVTSDGEIRRVDAESDPELFWALRGGGGSFGIVTALGLRLSGIPEVYAGALFFPWERSPEVLHAWLEWTRGLPDEVSSVGRILQLPGLPGELRGGKFAVVEAVVLGDEAGGAELLQPLRALGPSADTFATVPPAAIAELHMDPRDPLPYLGESLLVDALDGAAIDRFVAAAGPGSGSTLASAELRHLGGALARSAPDHGALARLDGAFLSSQLGVLADAEDQEAVRAQLDAVAEALAPYDSGRRYPSLTGARTDAARFYPPDVHRRLRQIKARVDPDELFRANHPIRPGV